MTKALGWVVAVALGTLPSAARAQSNQMQHPEPATTQAAPPIKTDSEVVWLRQRVEQLEAQLAGCSSDAKSKMKRQKASSMMPGTMGDDTKGGGEMGSMPMNNQPMGKMKSRHQSKMNSGGNKNGNGNQDSNSSPGNMGDM